ncbi:MAG TPA: phosphatidylserine/phosphatidylglycerophosphate/cardiolipin synthase family protein [Vicinamibacterales bacterium]|nr:phosphatidylserine/phosphatidylglycerophosphate/cardiolipin synthase family protein [Vicinamibacterales bacterium]
MQRNAGHIPYVAGGSYPIRGGNFVCPLVDGEPAFRRICAAVDAARASVWVTVAFIEPRFRMPDGRTLFDLLDEAHARGIDVRVLFWRHVLLATASPDAHFAGTEKDLAFLAERGTRWSARWDQADGRYCQHQKSWLIDAGQETETAFVGGINLNNNSVVVPGHPLRDDRANTHDVYVEIRGPSATDVHHNFVQRWNEASDKALLDGCWPAGSNSNDLPFPTRPSRPAGDVIVQVQRTVRRGRYTNGTAAPGAESFAIAEGEYGIVDQYLRAIEGAERTVYLEDQAIGAPEIVEALDAALGRGVDVVVLVPLDPNQEMAAARTNPMTQRFWESLGALGRHVRFLLAGLAGNREAGGYYHIYIHAKIALVDDAWCTIGSANIGNRSFFGDTELNASIWSEAIVRDLRQQLLREHLSIDTTNMGDRAAFARYREVARRNAARRHSGERLEGLAIAVDPATYAAQ